MKSNLVRATLLIFLFILLSVPPFAVHILLDKIGIAVSSKFHFSFFLIHLISVIVIVSVNYVKKGLVAYIYLVFLTLKMAFVILLVYKFSIIAHNVVLYFAFYWYYLILETFIVVMLLRNHAKVNSKILAR